MDPNMKFLLSISKAVEKEVARRVAAVYEKLSEELEFENDVTSVLQKCLEDVNSTNLDSIKSSGKKGGKKKKKDPNAPKKPKSAYFIFSAEHRPNKEVSSLAFADQGKKLGEMWRELKEAADGGDKAAQKKMKKYTTAAAKAKEQYDEDKAKYEVDKAE